MTQQDPLIAELWAEAEAEAALWATIQNLYAKVRELDLSRPCRVELDGWRLRSLPITAGTAQMIFTAPSDITERNKTNAYFAAMKLCACKPERSFNGPFEIRLIAPRPLAPAYGSTDEEGNPRYMQGWPQ